MKHRIGIVGGGQLGRMLAFSAKKLGYTVTVIDPTPNSPAGQVTDAQILGGYKDEKATRELAAISDVMTIDAEFVNDTVLDTLEKKGQAVYPSAHTIGIIKDKLRQKEFLKKAHIPTAAFIAVSGKEDIEQAATKFGYPLLLKARCDAYDGKGNVVLKSKNDIENGLTVLKDRDLYVEKFVSFKKEIAIMVARSTKGEVAVFPVVETIHKDNICDVVIAPGAVPKKVKEKAEKLGKKVVKLLDGIGVFGIEMFLDNNNNVLINEIAPRVHNSGHYTIEACITSQFEQHIRAIMGLPLGSTNMIVKFAVMKNILGEKNGNGFPEGIEKALAIENVSLHMYGKQESRPKRKMGHITVTGSSLTNLHKKIKKARNALRI